MSEWYADRLRDDAGRMEAQIDALTEVRHGYEMLRRFASADSPLHDFAGEQMDKLADQIGGLQRRVDDLDDDIHDEDPERPYIYRVL